MHRKECDMSRGKACYIVFIFSILFFLSSVFTFAVLAVTKEDNLEKANNKAKIIKKNQKSNIQQRKIIERLERIEKRVKEKENKKRGR